MSQEGIAVLIIVGSIFLFVILLIGGAELEWMRHRNYCDCKQCTDWRKNMKKQSEKLDPGSDGKDNERIQG